MNKLAGILIDFFRHFELLDTEKTFRKEIKNKHIILDDRDYEVYLSSLMNRHLRKEKENVKNAQKKIKKMKSMRQLKTEKKKNPLTEEETEDIMENLMNRLFSNYSVFEESTINSNIEKVFENPLFQKLYKETDVLKEAFDESDEHSTRNKLSVMNPDVEIKVALFKNKVLESQILNKNDISVSKSYHEPKESLDFQKKKNYMFQSEEIPSPQKKILM